MDLTNLRNIKEDNDKRELSQSRFIDSQVSQIETREAIVRSVKYLIEFLEGHTTKTAVINNIKSVKTPDVDKVTEAVENLHSTLKTHKNTDLSEVTKGLNDLLAEIKTLPKEFPEVKEKEEKDYTEQFISLEKAINAIEEAVAKQDLNVEAPQVNVESPVVNVEKPDLAPILKELANVVKSVKGIKIPETKETDIKPVVTEQKKTNKLLNELLDSSPGGGGGGGASWPAVNADGNAAPLTVDATGGLVVAGSVVYSVNDIADPYYGFTTSDGTWQVKKVEASAVSYATVLNNSGVTDYASAWSAKAALTYGRYHEAF